MEYDCVVVTNGIVVSRLPPRTLIGSHAEENVLFIYSPVDWNIVENDSIVVQLWSVNGGYSRRLCFVVAPRACDSNMFRLFDTSFSSPPSVVPT